MQRSRDWFNQSLKDLKAAKDSLASENYEWSCFQAHQSVEKGLKALLMTKNLEIWGHSLLNLYEKWIEIKENSELTYLKYVQELDRHYILSRYPNGYPGGYPAKFYNIEIAQTCVHYAEEIIEYIKERIK